MDDVPRGGAARLARVAHNHKVAGSNPAPATKKDFEAIQSLFCYIFFYPICALLSVSYLTERTFKFY